jgi:rhodanese-related sulfurtransferase
MNLPGTRLMLLLRVTVCSTVGYRSSQYAASLMDKGLTAVNLQGGIVGWVSIALG